MQVIGYIPLHYGAEYLESCIKSMADFVDKIIVIYAPNPSQGFNRGETCPETEKELRDIALGSSNKVNWCSLNFCTEGEHRNYIYQFTDGYDLVFTLDADEIVEPLDVEKAFRMACDNENRYIGISGFVHFWRSFNHICTDGYMPVRITNLKRSGQGQSDSTVSLRIYHFSCAQSEKIIRYKWGVSGHSPELRPGWIDYVLYGWTPENDMNLLHPVSLDIWGRAEPFDKNTLPDILKNHPNFNTKLI